MSGIPERLLGLLVVDDLAMNRELLTIMLETKGHEVVCAHSAQQALLLAREQAPDLVLVDISLPDMDGVRACAEPRTCAGCEHVPVVFISALSESRDKVRAFDAGAVDCNAKPFQMDGVLARVADAIHRLETRFDTFRAAFPG